MIAFSFQSLAFQPPLRAEKRLYITFEVIYDSAQTTKIFTYYPQTSKTTLDDTLEFLIKNPEKSSHVIVSLMEYGNPTQRHMKIGKETIQISKMSLNTPTEITLPTLYGTDAVLELTVETSDEFRDDTSFDGELPTEPNEPMDISPVKKRSRLERIFKKDRFHFLKLRPMSHESVFGLTPVVQTIEVVLDFINWKDPHRTFALSMLFTFFILYGQTLLGLGFLMYFVFHKKLMPYLLQPGMPEIYQQGKLQTYKKNFVFLRETTEKATQAYEIYKKLFLDQDNTLLIQMLLLVRKFSPAAVFALLAFDLRFLIITGYWTLLAYNRKTGREVLTRAFEEGHKLMSRIEVLCAPFLKFESKMPATERPRKNSVAEPPTNALIPKSRNPLSDITHPVINNGSTTVVADEKKPSIVPIPQTVLKQNNQVLKERVCITFENQRWWPGKGWRAELLPGERPAWSDDLGQVELKKEYFKTPGPNWEWENRWNIVISSKTDNEGWEYASRFKKFGDPERKKSLIQSVRRRKWVRKCVQFNELVN